MSWYSDHPDGHTAVPLATGAADTDGDTVADLLGLCERVTVKDGVVVVDGPAEIEVVMLYRYHRPTVGRASLLYNRNI